MYYLNSNKELALDYFQKSMEIAETANYKTGIANVGMLLG